MRRFIVVGGWYALLLSALLLAEPMTVSSSDAPVQKDSNEWSDRMATVRTGEVVETTGRSEEGYLEVKLKGGGTGWIAISDLFTQKEIETQTKTSGAGGGAETQAQEGAYVKGFDPEVEGQMRADSPGLDKIYGEEILPWIWEVRASKAGIALSQQLEEKEELQEKHRIQGKDSQADAMQKEIDDLRQKVQPYRDAWQAELRKFRQAGQIGEFARRK